MGDRRIAPTDFTHRSVRVNGITLHYVIEGSRETCSQAIVLCHGWPDLWFGWRYQIKALAKEGYCVIAPDLRGYGQTDAPEDYKSYTFKNITQDISELITHVGFERAIMIGHDWGGEVVWKMCLYHPKKVAAVAALCTPYTPRHSSFIPLEEIIKKLPFFAYQAYLIGPKAAAEFGSNAERFFRTMFRSSEPADFAGFPNMKKGSFLGDLDPPRSPMISQEELNYYVSEFTRRGFQGGLNWYKTRRENWEDEANLPRNISHQALMVTVGRDPVLTPAMAEKMGDYIPNLERAHIEEAAHWVLVEKSQEVNGILIAWLRSLSKKSKL